MSSTKKACICALCIALCSVLPIAFHAFAAGAALSPMHIPILLCGLVCSPFYGAFCGVAGPVISCLLTSMPSPVQLIYMVPELLTYGLAAGIFMKLAPTRSVYANVYIALVPAMILGRVVGGAARALFYLSTAGEYSLALWAAGYLAGTIPGIILQLIVIPALVAVLVKARVLPRQGLCRSEGKNDR